MEDIYDCKKTLDYKINPDEAVAMGVAMQGALLEKDESVKEIVMTDVCPYYVGINTLAYRKVAHAYEYKIFGANSGESRAERLTHKCLDDAEELLGKS